LLMRGKFITFEGGEGAGKSTQVKALVGHLRDQGLEVVQTREPGGSGGAEALRDLLVNGEIERWSALSETLMMYAARANHLEQVIRPALMRGAWVICDRFSDSTRAYQGAAGGVRPSLIETIDEAVVGETQPDLIILMDLAVEVGLSRAETRGGLENRFESKGIDFHQNLRDGFLQRAAIDPHRYRVFNADQSIEVLSAEIWQVVSGLWPSLKGA
jgi:dTMP kinase